MTHALLHPWSHGFMQRALLELLFVGVLGAVLGCWIVLYRLAYSAESLAHALFPGLVVAALLGIPLVAGGAVGDALGGLYVSYYASLAAGASVAAVAVAAFVLAFSLRPPPGLARSGT